MKISLWKERDNTRQAYVQLTEQEAKRLVEFLNSQFNENFTPKSITEKCSYEEYIRKNSPVPDTTKGIITYAIVNQEDTGA